MPTTSPDYMLIFRESTPERYAAMSADERRERLRDWNAWCDRLAAQGTLLSGHPLEDAGRVVSAGRAKGTMDGPFAEAKELIGGFFIIRAESFDEAEAIARQSPNLQYGMTVEIRPVAQACHLARSLGMTSMRETAAV
jgi:hypothetical protein